MLIISLANCDIFIQVFSNESAGPLMKLEKHRIQPAEYPEFKKLLNQGFSYQHPGW